eukprot:4037089-Pyramimonas_sp.AAC.1
MAAVGPDHVARSTWNVSAGQGPHKLSEVSSRYPRPSCRRAETARTCHTTRPLLRRMRLCCRS